MSFRDDQVAALKAKLSAKNVQTKVVNGFSLSYVEGWYTIAEANRIFGFDGWDRETVFAECVWQGQSHGVAGCSYVARVRVRVHTGDKSVVREGSGFGTGTGNTPGEAHEKALKEAETDAMKRALATFGNRFGLCLYDKDQQGVARGKRAHKPNGSSGSPSDSPPMSGWILKDPDGTALEIVQAPQLFFSKARKILEGLRNPTAIRQLWHNNEEALKAIRIAHPDLRDGIGVHYTVLFARLCKEQARIAEEGRSLGASHKEEAAGRRLANSEPTSSTSQLESQIEGLSAAGSSALDERQRSASEATISDGGANGHVLMVESGPPASNGNDSPLAVERRIHVGDSSNGTKRPPHETTHDEHRAARALADPGQESKEVNGHQPVGIDKSILPIGVPRRIRDKDHLRAVAAQPCVICGRSPSHAHHLTFVQPKARGLKPSDEWVVPLCYLHHRELHEHGIEQKWWLERAIDPISLARQFWLQTTS